MAIDKVKKAVIFIPNNVFEKFIVELKLLSAVEIISQETSAGQQILFNINPDEVKNWITKFDNTINILRKYYKLEIKKIDGYTLYLQPEEVKNRILHSIPVCEKVEQIDNEIKKLQQKLHHLNGLYELFFHFGGLEINFSTLKQTKFVLPYFIRIDAKNEKNFVSEISGLDNVYLLWQNKVRNSVFMFLVVFKDINTQFLDIAKKHETTFFDLVSVAEKDTVQQELEFLSAEISSCKTTIESYINEIKHICETQASLLYQTYLLCLDINDFFSVTAGEAKFVKILTCWVPNKYLHKVKQLCDKFNETVIMFFEPQENDDIPTVLYNKPVSEPYEFITTLYGYPKVGTVDPTELLAPFFTIFFALCLSDIFYGFLLIVLWLVLKNKISKSSEYYKLVILFKYLGITSVVIGIFMDSFLGMSIFKNFRTTVNLALFDPLNRPIDMLKFTFLLGLIQIISGLTTNAVKSFKHKEIADGIDSLSWVVFILIFAPVVYNLFFPKEVSPQMIKTSSKISLLVFIFIVVFQSRSIKPVFLKPINIFVKAYNTIGFYADILSYSRILALALASAAIAQTVNIFVGKLLNAQLFGLKYLEPVAAPVVFLGGHLFNFIMSVLGALVHSARLQYLEFFSKFFVSGGRPIKLFAPVSK